MSWRLRSATRYGEQWKSKADGNGLEQVDERILAAAKLAGFLLHEPQASDAQRSSALRVIEIIVTDFDKRGLFAINAEGGRDIGGADAPGPKNRGKPDANDKWAILRRWEETTPARFVEPGDYWTFSKNGLVHDVSAPVHADSPPTHERLRNDPSGPRDARPKRDDLGIIAADLVPL